MPNVSSDLLTYILGTFIAGFVLFLMYLLMRISRISILGMLFISLLFFVLYYVGPNVPNGEYSSFLSSSIVFFCAFLGGIARTIFDKVRAGKSTVEQ